LARTPRCLIQQDRTSGYPNRYDERVFATGCEEARPAQTSPA